MVSVTGRVLDYWTGKPLVGATVLLAGLLANTDQNGNYRVDNLPPSVYTVTVIHRDYERTEVTADLSVETAYTIDDIRVKPVFKAL